MGASCSASSANKNGIIIAAVSESPNNNHHHIHTAIATKHQLSPQTAATDDDVGKQEERSSPQASSPMALPCCPEDAPLTSAKPSVTATSSYVPPRRSLNLFSAENAENWISHDEMPWSTKTPRTPFFSSGSTRRLDVAAAQIQLLVPGSLTARQRLPSATSEPAKTNNEADISASPRLQSPRSSVWQTTPRLPSLLAQAASRETAFTHPDMTCAAPSAALGTSRRLPPAIAAIAIEAWLKGHIQSLKENREEPSSFGGKHQDDDHPLPTPMMLDQPLLLDAGVEEEIFATPDAPPLTLTLADAVDAFDGEVQVSPPPVAEGDFLSSSTATWTPDDPSPVTIQEDNSRQEDDSAAPLDRLDTTTTTPVQQPSTAVPRLELKSIILPRDREEATRRAVAAGQPLSSVTVDHCTSFTSSASSCWWLHRDESPSLGYANNSVAAAALFTLAAEGGGSASLSSSSHAPPSSRARSTLSSQSVDSTVTCNSRPPSRQSVLLSSRPHTLRNHNNNQHHAFSALSTSRSGMTSERQVLYVAETEDSMVFPQPLGAPSASLSE